MSEKGAVDPQGERVDGKSVKWYIFYHSGYDSDEVEEWSTHGEVLARIVDLRRDSELVVDMVINGTLVNDPIFNARRPLAPRPNLRPNVYFEAERCD